MENASKALLIAAGVLIAIIIITIGIKVYTSTSGTDKVALNTGKSISDKTEQATGLAISEVTGGVTWKYKDKNTIVSSLGQELKIGDYIAYDHTKDSKNNTVTVESGVDVNLNNYNAGWQVFGIDNEKVVLISAQPTYILTLSLDIDKLERYSKAYSHGKYAVDGRSLNLKDVNDITGFNPLTAENGKPYHYGNIDEYGNEIEYYWKGTEYPYYTDGNRSGNLTSKHKVNFLPAGFSWYDENGNNHLVQLDTNQESQFIGKIKSTAYTYDIGNYISYNSPYYKILIAEVNNYGSFLATSFTRIETGSLRFGMFYFSGREVTNSNGVYSIWGTTSTVKKGVRPLITLSAKANIVKNSTNDGSNKDKACLIK